MKHLISIVLILIALPLVKAQRNTDFGLLVGGAYYLGEYNPTKQFYSPSPSFGGFFRWNINKRYAARISGYYLSLRANDNDFPGRVDPYIDYTSFSTSLIDFSVQAEFNFAPYITGEQRFLNSLYIAGGIGYSNSLNGNNSLIIPFGLGFKINLSDRMSIGAEWSFRKTFIDDIDNFDNPLGHTLLNNNDWYSIFGLFISYKFVKFAADCPVYK
jgi:hypothetical protein